MDSFSEKGEKFQEDVAVSTRMLKRHIQAALDELEYLISATPSGNSRNLLTNANLHIMLAQSEIKESN